MIEDPSAAATEDATRSSDSTAAAADVDEFVIV